MAASIATLRRPAFAGSGPRRNRAALRVVAFRDTHRAKQLVDTAKEFALAWATGHREGPTKPVMRALEHICADDIRVRATGLQACIPLKGLNGIRAKLARHQETAADLSTPAHAKAEVILAAANDNTDAAFCLVRVPGLGPGRPEAYMLLKMDVMLDDGARTVTSVEERGQLSDAYLLAGGKSPTNQAAPPFPRDLIKPWPQEVMGPATELRHPGPDMVQRVEEVLKAWTSARNTGTDVWAMMDKAGCDQDFKLLDAYGCLPQVSTLKATGRTVQSQPGSAGFPESPAPAAAHPPTGEKELAALGVPLNELAYELSRKAMRDELEGVKTSYDVDCRLLDCAVCLDEAAAFAHWRASQKNRITGVDQEFEGMEVDILDPVTGGLKAVYLFQDYMDSRAPEEQDTLPSGLKTPTQEKQGQSGTTAGPQGPLGQKANVAPPTREGLA